MSRPGIGAQRPWALRAWALLTTWAAPLITRLLAYRARLGKEDPARLSERMGVASAVRPQGQLVWLHGASVGESLVAWTVARALQTRRPGLNVLLTSGTRTSADLIASRIASLESASILHQYLPTDTVSAATCFMQHWKPDLCVFVEGEIWPNILHAARLSGAPTALINARMTAKSLANWRRFPGSAQELFGGFELTHAADIDTHAGLAALSHKAPQLNPANLKLAAPVPALDTTAIADLRRQIAGRPVWLAASTHEGEEQLVVAAHALLQVALPSALLILAPRHPERAPDVRVTCTLAGMSHVSRAGEYSGDLAPATDVLIWNTIGELGVAMAECPVTLLAGALVPGIGGHNPVEPLQVGSAVITGPYGFNFADLFATLNAAGGIRILQNVSGDTIAMSVAALLGDDALRQNSVLAGQAAIANGGQGLEDVCTALIGLLK